MTTARKATLDDLPAMLEMAKPMHEESRYAAYALDMTKLENLFSSLIRSPRGIVLLTTNGMLVGGVAEYFFSSALYAFQFLVYVNPEARGSSEAPALIKAYIEEAKALRAVDVHIENSTGCEIEKVERLFTKLGFARTGGNFIMEL